MFFEFESKQAKADIVLFCKMQFPVGYCTGAGGEMKVKKVLQVAAVFSEKMWPLSDHLIIFFSRSLPFLVGHYLMRIGKNRRSYLQFLRRSWWHREEEINK